jgi:hypothetical protein
MVLPNHRGVYPTCLVDVVSMLLLKDYMVVQFDVAIIRLLPVLIGCLVLVARAGIRRHARVAFPADMRRAGTICGAND